MANTKQRRPVRERSGGSAGRPQQAQAPPEVDAGRPVVRRRWHSLALAAGLAVLTMAVYARVGQHDFVALDDTVYVTGNAHVAGGLTASGLIWAFTAMDPQAANWHPITWISHMLDVELFGMRPGAHHLMSAGLHTLNALLLFWVLDLMTGRMWRSACVAALFALHPLHVESVAWIAERKDVLSTLFWFLTIWAYVGYTRRPGRLRYAAVILLFALGLMAKPMVVTLPFTLLLLDWWPLNRIGVGAPAGDGSWGARLRPWVPLLVEKWPLFVLSALSSVLTVAAQRQGGAVVALEAIPMTTRAANAVLAYGTYAWQMVWPSGLSVFYPHPGVLPVAATAAALLLLIGISVAAARGARRRPHLIVGWLWYLGTLAPVIGLVQVGMQARADRYTYVPLIGLFIAIVWECAQRAATRPAARVVTGLAASGIIAAFAVTSHAQVAYWSDDASLWGHALELDADNYYAHYRVAVADLQHGQPEKAVPHLERALRLAPWFAEVHDTMGVARARSGQLDAAIAEHLEALRWKPGLLAASFNLGLAYEQRGDLDLAAARYRDAIRSAPENATFHAALGHVLAQQGQHEAAATEFRSALQTKPDFASAHAQLGTVLLAQGHVDEALDHLREAVRLEPGSAEDRATLGAALADHGRLEEAIAQYGEGVRLAPGDPDLRHALGLCLARQGRLTDAVSQFSEAVRIRPGSDTMQVSLGMALAATGDAAGGAARFNEALRINPNNQAARSGLQALGRGGTR